MMRATAADWSSGRGVSPEAINRWTHGFGFAASVPAAAYLFRTALSECDRQVTVAFAVYCVALVGLYAASALSHAFEDRPHIRSRFRTADQVCIYLMIAGTFTPFAAACLWTPIGIAQLVAMWVLACCGIWHRVRSRGEQVGLLDVGLCLVTGWIPVVSLAQILEVGGTDGFCLVVAGGLFYSGGTAFLMNDHRNAYLHGVWHLATLAGTGCHYLFLLNHVACA